jgi:hypothetical protein
MVEPANVHWAVLAAMDDFPQDLGLQLSACDTLSVLALNGTS